MAEAYQVSVSFSGVEQVKELQASFSHGISPSVFTLTIAPQADFDGEGGTLTISDGEQLCVFADCKVDRATFELTESGMLWRLSIFDRRWKWAFPTIDGAYNLRQDSANALAQSVIPRTERTPQQLAALLLEAMGEEEYDVGEMPNEQRPQVEWQGDPAAEELATLCDELQCFVVLSLDGAVKICVAGQGADLPDGGVLEDSLTIDLPERPDAIGVLGGPARYGVDFALEAVGEEIDGTVVPIDELSYTPVDGWGTADFPLLTSIKKGNPQAWQKAATTVLRWYRVKFPATIVEVGSVDTIDQLKPIYDEQANLIQDASDVDYRREPAQVFGVWSTQSFVATDNLAPVYPNNVGLPRNNGIDPGALQPCCFYEGDFSIDRNRGIVMFSELLKASPRLITAAEPNQPAKLWLRTSCAVRDEETNAWIRYERVRQLGDAFGSATRFLKHDEFERNVAPVYASGGFNIDHSSDNSALLDQEADDYIDAALNEYAQPVAETRKYAGLAPTDLDGAIQHILFSLSTSGFFSVVARSTEQIAHCVPFKERRMLERSRRIDAVIKQNKPAMLAKAIELQNIA